MAFNPMNAFRLVDVDGGSRFVRDTLFTERGEHSLPVEERVQAGVHHLMEGVVGELPIRHRVVAQIAHDDDQTTDASKGWPADRERVDLGTTVITALDTERDRDSPKFDPTQLTDGIEPRTTRSCASGPGCTRSRCAVAPVVHAQAWTGERLRRRAPPVAPTCRAAGPTLRTSCATRAAGRVRPREPAALPAARGHGWRARPGPLRPARRTNRPGAAPPAGRAAR